MPVPVGHRDAGERSLPVQHRQQWGSGGEGPLLPSVCSAQSCDFISVQILGFNFLCVLMVLFKKEKKFCPCNSTCSAITAFLYEPLLFAVHPCKWENPLSCQKDLFHDAVPYFGANGVGIIGIHTFPRLCVWLAVFLRSEAVPFVPNCARSRTNFA